MSERDAYWREKRRRRERPGIDSKTGVDLGALGDEIIRLRAIDEPCAIFTLKPFEAYTLIATLQGTSRNPMLTPTQRDLVLGFARQVQAQLVAMARAVIGPDSLIERTTEMGFDPANDVPRDPAGEVSP